MKYYKFIEDYDWDEIESKIEEVAEQESEYTELESQMKELMDTTEGVEVDDYSEDGFYVEDGFGEVYHDGDSLYEFEIV